MRPPCFAPLEGSLPPKDDFSSYCELARPLEKGSQHSKMLDCIPSPASLRYDDFPFCEECSRSSCTKSLFRIVIGIHYKSTARLQLVAANRPFSKSPVVRLSPSPFSLSDFHRIAI